MSDLERAACIARKVSTQGFNRKAVIPYGCSVQSIQRAMDDFVDFLTFINGQLYTKKIERLEAFLMPANFSSMVGEFMSAAIPKYCKGLVRNQYHNGHPDLIPAGKFPRNAIQYAKDGIEVKASRYLKAWQGHNPESVWLMVFVFECNGPKDAMKEIPPKPFRFLKVVGAKLDLEDWQYSGRGERSRRTITASVKQSGFEKMEANWIYGDPEDYPKCVN